MTDTYQLENQSEREDMDNRPVVNVVDFQFLYYKYMNSYMSGRLKDLSYNGKETTLIYYPVSDIESISKHGKIETHVCFDSKTQRKDENADYKGKRKSTLSANDHDNIDAIKNLLTDVGYKVYKRDGYEADDIVASVTRKLLGEGKRVVVWTIDKDLLQLVQPGVDVQLYRLTKGYTRVTRDNFEETASQLFKVYMPYNMVKAYKCLCGDPSDNIKGVKGFGPAAFGRWTSGRTDGELIHRDSEYLVRVLKATLNENQVAQAAAALSMVELRYINDIEPLTSDKPEITRENYKDFGMTSFLEHK